MAPPPDASHASLVDLTSALKALPSRSAALLLRRLAQGASSPDCAAFYGISPGAFQVHLLRAALALAQALGLPMRPPENPAEEALWAQALADALERDTGPVPAALGAPVALCRRVRAVGPELRAALREAERAEEDSPKRRREDWLRRLAILALLALTAWLYLQRTG